MDDREFRAGRAGERPFAPDVPTNENFSGEYVPQGMLDKIKQNLFMGGATDVRNMGRAVAPAGLSMMLARPVGMLGGAARGGNALRDPAEQMFDVTRAAPKMAQGGFIDPQLLRMLGYAIPAAGAAYGGYKIYDAVKGLGERMNPANREERSEGMLGGAMYAEAKPSPEMLGTGAARKAADKLKPQDRRRRLDEEEDRATKAG